MAFCINCGKDIGGGSSACDACGHKRPSAVAPLVGGIIVGATLAFMVAGAVDDDSPPPRAAAVAETAPEKATPAVAAVAPTVEPTPAKAPEPAKPAPPPEPKSAWVYELDEDPMTSAKTYWATVTSTNQIELGFPYGGPQRARLMLRTHPRYGKSVIFQIERGQLLCPSYDGCTVLVRFDEDKPVRYNASGPSDNSSETLFLSNYGGFAERLLRAKRVRISAEIYQSGAPVFEFDVAGFDVKKYRPE